MPENSQKVIAIASGKGGTGKTMIATNLAMVLPGCSLVDCDVEEPNAHIFVHPEIVDEKPVTGNVPQVVEDKCDACGKCVEACRFNALALAAGQVLTFPELCHNCGVCFQVCPKDALTAVPHELGTVRLGRFAGGRAFADGLLKIGQVRSAEVIARLKKAAVASPIAIHDCPPGTSCSMVSAVRDATVAALVTEPTPFGLHDLEAAVGALEWLGIPHCVIINKSGLGTGDTEAFCRTRGIPIAGTIPFEEDIARIVSAGELLVDRARYRDIFEKIADAILNGPVRKIAQHKKPQPTSTDDAQDFFERCAERPARTSARTVAVISGKGGTGKTTLAACLAAVAENRVLADCDVDAANLHLLINHKVQHTFPFRSSYQAVINQAKCTGCGLCARMCAFDAIKMTPKATVDPFACEGCGMCHVVCPLCEFEDECPVSIEPQVDGEAYESTSDQGDFFHAQLYPGGEASGKLVTLLRRMAEATIAENGADTILIDGSPGVGCPVNASIASADLAVVVCEPTASAAHDLERVFSLARHFAVDAAVIINRADINEKYAKAIENMCAKANVPIVGRIGFDRTIVESMAKQIPPVLDEDCNSRGQLRQVCENVIEMISEKKGGR